MKQIKSDFSFTNARNAEHMQLHTNMLEVITPEFATAQGLTERYNVYKAAEGNEEDCFLSNQAFEDTPELQASDRTRDYAFYLVANVVDAYEKYAIDQEELAAGKRLAYIIRPARNAAQKGYAEETALLTDLYGKLLDPASAPDLATLHLTEAVEAAKAANEAFNTLYVARSAEMASRATTATMKELRPKTDAAFRELAEAINALYLVNAITTKDAEKEAALGGAIDAANGLLIQLDRVIRARLGKGSGSTTTPEEPSDTDKEPTTDPERPEPTDPENPGGDSGKDDEGQDLPFEPVDPNPDEEETPSVV